MSAHISTSDMLHNSCFTPRWRASPERVTYTPALQNVCISAISVTWQAIARQPAEPACRPGRARRQFRGKQECLPITHLALMSAGKPVCSQAGPGDRRMLIVSRIKFPESFECRSFEYFPVDGKPAAMTWAIPASFGTVPADKAAKMGTSCG
jgi:hypothetical protein